MNNRDIGTAIKPDPSKIASAIHDFLTEDIKSAGKQTHDLGRFLFGVSTGTIGLFVALKRLGNQPLSEQDIFPISCFVISLLVALYLGIPKTHKIGANTDIVGHYRSAISQASILSVVWLVGWLLGSGSMLLRVFN